MPNNEKFDSTYTVTRGIYDQLGGTSQSFDSTYAITLAILEGLISGTLGPGGGGSGSVVSISDLLPSGSKIATLTINGHANSIYIPDVDEYADKTGVTSSINDATESVKTWVGQQGYLTEHQDISYLATTASVNSVSESVEEVKAEYTTTASLNSLSSSWASMYPSGNYTRETWSFTLADSSSVSKVILVG